MYIASWFQFSTHHVYCLLVSVQYTPCILHPSFSSVHTMHIICWFQFRPLVLETYQFPSLRTPSCGSAILTKPKFTWSTLLPLRGIINTRSFTLQRLSVVFCQTDPSSRYRQSKYRIFGTGLQANLTVQSVPRGSGNLHPFFKFLLLLFFYFLHLYCRNGIFSMGNSGCFPGESQLRQSQSTLPTVHAGCFSVSIVHRTLT